MGDKNLVQFWGCNLCRGYNYRGGRGGGGKGEGGGVAAIIHRGIVCEPVFQIFGVRI
jgi:hypothetical protein